MGMGVKEVEGLEFRVESLEKGAGIAEARRGMRR
jgi:hypothetical protein